MLMENGINFFHMDALASAVVLEVNRNGAGTGSLRVFWSGNRPLELAFECPDVAS